MLGIATGVVNFRPPSGSAMPGRDTAASRADFDTLKGRWQRPDGGSVLAINSITGKGGIEAAYYNPQPIHIAKAEASKAGAVTNIFVELRDANYPGSTYTLTYDPGGDRLQGIYYQAVEKQRFPVVFVRLK